MWSYIALGIGVVGAYLYYSAQQPADPTTAPKPPSSSKAPKPPRPADRGRKQRKTKVIKSTQPTTTTPSVAAAPPPLPPTPSSLIPEKPEAGSRSRHSVVNASLKTKSAPGINQRTIDVTAPAPPPPMASDAELVPSSSSSAPSDTEGPGVAHPGDWVDPSRTRVNRPKVLKIVSKPEPKPKAKTFTRSPAPVEPQMTRSRKRHLKRREEEKEARRQHDVLQDLRLRQHRRERMELVIRDQIKKDKGPPVIRSINYWDRDEGPTVAGSSSIRGPTHPPSPVTKSLPQAKRKTRAQPANHAQLIWDD